MNSREPRDKWPVYKHHYGRIRKSNWANPVQLPNTETFFGLTVFLQAGELEACPLAREGIPQMMRPNLGGRGTMTPMDRSAQNVPYYSRRLKYFSSLSDASVIVDLRAVRSTSDSSKVPQTRRKSV
jgi:hypothetical protein